MTMIDPPADPGPDGLRLRYEAGVEPVREIASAAGLTMAALVQKARAEGWALRNRAGSAAATRRQTTRQTLRRLKDMLNAGAAELELRLKGGDDFGEDKDMRALNTIVRTLEKVIDLERKDSLRRRREKRSFTHFDDTQRAELAEKIARLEQAWASEKAGSRAADGGSGGTEQAVALLGEGRPASA